MKASPFKVRPAPRTAPLAEAPFAPNPGNLRMFRYLPRGLKAGAPLVVVLHGCGQSASGYDLGAGWCQLADALGFAVLAPEQKAVNNPNTCFNWFNPEDITRGGGEAASIAAMITNLVQTHKLDASRVFITGLSAGGAMTAVMLANYPELFAGGAIIAGLPFGAAANVRDALENMRSAPLRTPQQWGDAVRAASDHKGPWPRVSIWHGALDTTVNINNAQASVAQWADVQGLSLPAAKQQMVDGAIHLSWGDKLELYTIAGLGHGTPIDSHDVGQAAPFILDVGISSTRRIAAFWGLVPAAVAAKPAAPKPAPVRVVAQQPALPKIEAALQARLEPIQAPMQTRVENVILRALKAAGLMKR
ncbi:MAG TPA: PHB depolymerase family esterase [Rhizomicrobium sp.]|nr:PHB depolymerase family esterase [Rhizomicrobium sp.]